MKTEEEYNAEVLQLMRDLYPTLKGEEKEMAERLFPELKENEDERIRKWIKKELESKYVVDNIVNDVMADKAFAWLKKHTNKPNNVYDKELSEILGCVVRRYINDPNISYNEREKVSREIIPYIERLEKQGEQNPAWGEEDEKMFNSALWHIKNSCGNGGKNSGEFEVYNWLKALKERYTWKPSEEQMYALSAINVTGDISYAGQGQELINLYNDLKKLL